MYAEDSCMIPSAVEFARDIAKQKEDLLLKQMNWLISRGILVIKEGQPSHLVKKDDGTVEFQQGFELVVKDAEYIEKLEKENADLKAVVESIMQCVAMQKIQKDELCGGVSSDIYTKRKE